MLQVPKICPNCGSKLNYISDVQMIPDTNPPEAGLEGTCFECETVIFSKFRMCGIEIMFSNKEE